MKVREPEEFLSYIERITSKMSLEKLIQFNRYVDTYLIHVIDVSILNQIKKIIKGKERLGRIRP